ncbi:MAG: Hsp20/alpha crystallin family protein [Chlamydiae bacterium CG10_big_fil_rev_8_21_14_0_10_35_9]|nr:MAG: Hsp20/alpha crystallin family protein [Chlamydiae bacterium CG10_big_fil_rev_8_21_14_0_10_35_9]
MSKDDFKSMVRSFMNFPFFEEDFWGTETSVSGLSISEDEKNVYVEAHLPGLQPEDIEISFEKGALFIKGSKKEETKEEKKKYYKKASSSFSYRVNIPSQVDESKEPEATYKDGVIKITFPKSGKAVARKISIKK